MTTKEFNQKIKDGEAKVLTLEAAKALKGKTIIWTYFGYEHNEQYLYETNVGDIISELDYNETQPMEGWKSRSEYWRSYMSEAKLKQCKDTLFLLDADNQLTHINCYLYSDFFDEPTFTCSDEDRCVYYIEK